MFSELKKFSRPITIGLICLFGIFLTVYTLRPLLWPGETGISDTLDKIFWGDTLKIERNEAILSKTNETVISKTVEKDKKGNIVKTIEINKYDDRKTLWDWGSLLVVPSSLLLFGYVLQLQQQKRAEKLSKEQQERAEDFSKEQQERAEKFAREQQKIADNETKEEVLQTYFDRLSVLLIDKNLIALSNKLNSNNIETEEKELLESSLDVIRARTLSILRRFANDAERKTSVIKFLVETEIVGKSKLNLQGAELQDARLQGTNLQGAKLQEVNLQGAKLQGAKLQDARLQFAELQRADLKWAELQGAELQEVNLQGAKLQGAELQRAILISANLEGANLEEANLEEANLEEANLEEANLEFAFLQSADLKDIKCNSKTVWPDKSAFIGAKNIPEELKKELGITP